MKTTIFKYFFVVLLLFFIAACDRLDVKQNQVAIDEDVLTGTAFGAYNATTSVLKQGFEAHQNIMWCASLIGQEELKSTGSATQFPFANQIVTSNLVAADNTQNNANVRFVYRTFEFVRIARIGIDKNEFSLDAGQNQKAKDLLLANIKLMEGMMYADMAKFYESVPEPETAIRLTPDDAKNKAIALLQEARGHFQSFNANTAAVPSVNNVNVATGLLGNTGQSGEKLCNSLIGMIYFDMGPRANAGSFLQQGYVAADAVNQHGYRVINLLTGPGVYPLPINYVSFQLNDYSDSFVANRITGDEFRRGGPGFQWYNPVQSLANRISYFFPTPSIPAPGTTVFPAVPATARVIYPIVSWQEVALMLAELNLSNPTTVKTSVLQSWGISAANAATLAADPAVSLERVARYEYIYRGRRWSAVNNASPGRYPKWPLSVNFNFN